MNCALHIQQRWPSSVQIWLFFTNCVEYCICLQQYFIAERRISDHISETEPIKLSFPKVKTYIFWRFVCRDKALAADEEDSICIDHCGQLHLSLCSVQWYWRRSSKSFKPQFNYSESFPNSSESSREFIVDGTCPLCTGPVQDNE